MTQQALVPSSNITIGHLLDRSGSMSGTEEQVVEAIHLFLQRMSSDKKGNGAMYTLRQFDSMGFDVLRRGPVYGVKPIEVSEYQPRALTPLYDAIADTIKLMEAYDSKRNMLIIQTDGLENDSKKHSLADIKALINQKRRAGWLIIYLGANIDACKQAEEIGIPEGRAMNYKQGNKDIPDQAQAAKPWSKFGDKVANNPLAYALGTIALLGLGYLLLNSNETNAANFDQLGFADADRNAAMGVTGVGDDTWQNAVATDVDGFTEPFNSFFDLPPDLAEQYAQMPSDFDPALGSMVDGQQISDDGHDILSGDDSNSGHSETTNASDDSDDSDGHSGTQESADDSKYGDSDNYGGDNDDWDSSDASGDSSDLLSDVGEAVSSIFE